MTEISLEIVDCPRCDRSFEIERGDDAVVKRHVLFEHGSSDEPDDPLPTSTPTPDAE